MSDDAPAAVHVEAYSWYWEGVRACTACTARNDARLPVPGIGRVPNKIMIVGRNPGELEDRQNLPFIGPSGQLVDKWLVGCGVSREQVFITNAVLCHTAANRIPKRDEISTCSKLWLLKTLAFVQPKFVIPMGDLAAKLFGVKEPITKVSGSIFEHANGFYVMPVIHAGGVLRKSSLRTLLDYSQEVAREFIKIHHLV